MKSTINLTNINLVYPYSYEFGTTNMSYKISEINYIVSVNTIDWIDYLSYNFSSGKNDYGISPQQSNKVPSYKPKRRDRHL